MFWVDKRMANGLWWANCALSMPARTVKTTACIAFFTVMRWLPEWGIVMSEGAYPMDSWASTALATFTEFQTRCVPPMAGAIAVPGGAEPTVLRTLIWPKNRPSCSRVGRSVADDFASVLRSERLCPDCIGGGSACTFDG